MKFHFNYQSVVLLQRLLQRQRLFMICAGLVILFLLYDRFPRLEKVEQIDSEATVRIHIWAIRDDRRFTDKEYDELLTSSLQSQHFDPPADSRVRSNSWSDIIEGQDDYFASGISDLNLENVYESSRSSTCMMPIKNVLFLKTHFTGSDVVTNIINRYADLRQLLVALPSDGLSSFYWPLKFDWRYMDMKRLQGNLPNVLCNHARYNAEVMEKFMPFNTQYVTILRNPLDYFVTLFEKLDISKRMEINSTSNPFETFVLNIKSYLKQAIGKKRFFDTMNLLKNGMFFDLGLRTSEYNDEIGVNSAIFDIQKKFSMVLIYEYLDESLVLMKRKFCWDTDDVIYLSATLPRSPSSSVVVSRRARRAVAEWNMADAMLYESFNASFWETIRREKDFNSEVIAFKARRKAVEAYCGGESKDNPSNFPVLNNTLSTQTKPEDLCKKMAMSTRNYLDYFRDKTLVLQ